MIGRGRCSNKCTAEPIVHTSPGATNDAGACCKRHPQRRLIWRIFSRLSNNNPLVLFLPEGGGEDGYQCDDFKTACQHQDGHDPLAGGGQEIVRTGDARYTRT